MPRVETSSTRLRQRLDPASLGFATTYVPVHELLTRIRQDRTLEYEAGKNVLDTDFSGVRAASLLRGPAPDARHGRHGLAAAAQSAQCILTQRRVQAVATATLKPSRASGGSDGKSMSERAPIEASQASARSRSPPCKACRARCTRCSIHRL